MDEETDNIKDRIDFDLLGRFLKHYKSVDEEYRELSELWNNSGYGLNPSAYAMTSVFFIPGMFLALLTERYEGAMALLTALVFLYFFAYFPYHKELPTFGRMWRRWRRTRDVNAQHEDLVREGDRIAKSMGISFSDNGFFFVGDKFNVVIPHAKTIAKSFAQN